MKMNSKLTKEATYCEYVLCYNFGGTGEENRMLLDDFKEKCIAATCRYVSQL